MVKYGYRNNEWVVRYQDYDGKVQIEFLDTREEAIDFISRCVFPIGMMTTAFYNHYIEKVAESER